LAIILSDQEVRTLVNPEDMLTSIESMQKQFGKGNAGNLPRRKIISDRGMLAVMGGALFYDDVMGVKTYTVFNGKYSFQVSLYDTNTGELLCYTQANRLGQLRTGATTAIAAKYLANPQKTPTIGIIGSGNQSFTQIEALSLVTTPKEVLVYSKTPENRTRLASTVDADLGISSKAVSTAEELVSSSDIIVCIAATMTPIIKGESIQPGSTIIAAGPTSWRARELDDLTIQRCDKFVVDSIEQVNIESGDLSEAQDRGSLQVSQLIELRHIVAGNIQGRESSSEVVLAKVMGTGVADVAAAKLAYDKALEGNVGTNLNW
tara:strand:+ start:188 stop:1144 length:957 start_codon:yes stop_codon:yes gene_type:complete